MTYKEALFFIGKCLTLSLWPERKEEIRKVIRSGSVVWEQVVWTSTDQLVFTALHLQLKRAGLLEELPSELIEYMEEFTSVNRERNHQLMCQAHEITELLNNQGIVPIFLKGVGHLLDGLYDDIGERQVGDIDILVKENNMVRAAEILIAEGYFPSTEFDPNSQKVQRHYPRLLNENRTGAVEIHRQIFTSSFYETMDNELIVKNGRMLNTPSMSFVMSNVHQVVYNILNVQISDKAYYYAKVFLRQIYDLLMLSRREDPMDAMKGFEKFFHLMNVNLALADQLLDHPGTISFHSNWRTKLFIFRVFYKLNHPLWSRVSNGILYLWFRCTNSANYFLRAIYDRNIRRSVYHRLGNPKWYYEHLKSYK